MHTYVRDDISAALQLERKKKLFLIALFQKVARSRIYRRLSENSDAYVTNFLESLLNKGKKFMLEDKITRPARVLFSWKEFNIERKWIRAYNRVYSMFSKKVFLEVQEKVFRGEFREHCSSVKIDRIFFYF